MTRRTFLFLMVALIALTPKQAQATMTLKGFIANADDLSLMNQFAPDWVFIGFGNWLWDYSKHYGATKFAIAAHDVDPTTPLNAVNIALAMAHEAYDHRWILLREPDLNQTPQQAANEANAQSTLILSCDPLAKFCLSVGTGINQPYQVDSYAQQLFALIQNKPAIDALGVTYYPYQNVPPYPKFMTKLAAWRTEREKWVLECGLVAGAPTEEAFDLPMAFATTKAARVSWYALEAIPNTPAAGYDCLLDANGQITPTGVQFQNV